MNTQIEVAATQALERAPVTPMDLIHSANMQDVSLERMQQLFDLQLRWEANEAQKAYSVAFAAFKAEGVRIIKNADVKAGPLAGSKYADLFGVVNVLVPVLSRHGLSHSWKLSKDEKDWMEVTCTIKHVLGHSESVAMGGAPDIGPGRNAMQARGSSKTYLERYTFLAATGYAAAGTDLDGNAPTNKAGMPEKEFASWLANIEGAADGDSLKKYFNAAYAEAQQAQDKGAMKQFSAARDARRKELGV